MQGGVQESLVPIALSNMVNLQGRCSVSEKPPASCSLTCTAQAETPQPVELPAQ